jgi:DNA-binding IclR family transcriptional regulator
MASSRRPPAPPSPAARTTLERGQRGIQSVEVGGKLLQTLAHHGRPMALKDLAAEAGMPAAKAHPYLVSFGKLGLIVQDGGTGRYGLGPLAMQLGLISLQQFDPIRLATPVIAELALQLNLTVAMAVWGNRGATMVRIEEAPAAVHVVMRHGTVMSLRGTASGLLFAAYMPADEVLRALAAEAAEAGSGAPPRRIDEALARQLDEIRLHGVSRAVDALVTGVSAMAAPVFDERGAIVLSLTAIGPSAMVDTRWDGVVATRLRDAAQRLTRQMGAEAPAVAVG